MIHMKIQRFFFYCLVLAVSSTAFGSEKEVPLIPRKLLFGNPDKAYPLISPGGTRIAYLAPSKEGVMNIWVVTVGKQDDKMVTNDPVRGIFDFLWGYSDDYILFFQDTNGDENDHLKSVDLRNGDVRDLTPYKDVRATNLLKDDQHPEEVMIGLNRRDPRLFDMYRVNLLTGDVKLEAENPGDVIGWTTDRQFKIRAATAFREDLNTAIRVRDSLDKPWRDLLVTPFERTPFLGQYNGGSLVIGFHENGKILYAATSMNSDTTQLVSLDVETGKILEVLAEDPNGDLWESGDNYEVLQDKKTGAVQAAAFQYLKPHYKVINKNLQQDFAILEKAESGVFKITSRDMNDSIWMVKYTSDVKPDVYYLYYRQSKKLEPLIHVKPELEKYTFAPQKGIEIPARDGMKLVSYLTLPVGLEPKKLPLVLTPHGGPWYRDEWGFYADTQWLANRGYAVLQVNFRGSSGFGLKYMNAGTGQWCTGSMQNDLTDAVKWAISEGIADPERVAIYGGSYGGYATLCGIVYTPELYVAAVDMVGPSDVGYLLKSFPEYWKPVKKRWIRRIGVDAEKDQENNRRISPLYHVEKIRTPLLIAHGSNDPRVKQAASDQIVAAMREKKLPVTYIVYPDEGHGLGREPNILDFTQRMEEFLAHYLKGRLEPPSKIEGSSVQIK
jgi:dipeptidyl aminopeptidase/acylaminoacyl peptidase